MPPDPFILTDDFKQMEKWYLENMRALLNRERTAVHYQMGPYYVSKFTLGSDDIIHASNTLMSLFPALSESFYFKGFFNRSFDPDSSIAAFKALLQDPDLCGSKRLNALKYLCMIYTDKGNKLEAKQTAQDWLDYCLSASEGYEISEYLSKDITYMKKAAR